MPVSSANRVGGGPRAQAGIRASSEAGLRPGSNGAAMGPFHGLKLASKRLLTYWALGPELWALLFWALSPGPCFSGPQP
jgi:hypothetical protein